MQKLNVSKSDLSKAAVEAFDVSTFCAAYRISRAFFYKLQKQGHGPRLMKVGRRTLISKSAAAEWQVKMEMVDVLAEERRNGA